MIKVNSSVKINFPTFRQLEKAQVIALEQTAEALHAKVVQAQVVPRMDGALQNEDFFVDTSFSAYGRVSLIHATPYARRLYFHPEYKFQKGPWEEYVVEKDGKKKHLDSAEAAETYREDGWTVHHYTHEGNPNAKGLWFEDWKPGGSRADFAIDTFKELYRRLTKL